MRGTTTHEFGHALGMLHEQSYPNGIKWNKDTVYKYYEKYQGWDKAKVDFNVLEASDFFYTNGTTYDPQSIMHYPVLAWQTVDGLLEKMILFLRETKNLLLRCILKTGKFLLLLFQKLKFRILAMAM